MENLEKDQLLGIVHDLLRVPKLPSLPDGYSYSPGILCCDPTRSTKSVKTLCEGVEQMIGFTKSVYVNVNDREYEFICEFEGGSWGKWKCQEFGKDHPDLYKLFDKR